MRSGKISFLLKLVILGLAVYGIVTLMTMREQITQSRNEAASLTAAIAKTEGENARLQENIDSLSTEEGVESIARSELGLVSPGEIVFKEVGN